MGGVVHIALRTARAHPHRAVCWVHIHALHHRQVDNQPIVATPQSRSIVAAAAYGDEQLIFAAEVYCRDDIGRIRAPGDHEWPLVDHSVVELARVLVGGMVTMSVPRRISANSVFALLCMVSSLSLLPAGA